MSSSSSSAHNSIMSDVSIMYDFLIKLNVELKTKVPFILYEKKRDNALKYETQYELTPYTDYFMETHVSKCYFAAIINTPIQIKIVELGDTSVSIQWLFPITMENVHAVCQPAGVAYKLPPNILEIQISMGVDTLKYVPERSKYNEVLEKLRSLPPSKLKESYVAQLELFNIENNLFDCYRPSD
jgi:hypothetical protein